MPHVDKFLFHKSVHKAHIFFLSTEPAFGKKTFAIKKRAVRCNYYTFQQQKNELTSVK